MFGTTWLRFSRVKPRPSLTPVGLVLGTLLFSVGVIALAAIAPAKAARRLAKEITRLRQAVAELFPLDYER